MTARQVPQIIILPDRAALAREAATRFVARAGQVIAARTLSRVEGRFAVALSGSSTPRDLCALLATPDAVRAAQVDWSAARLQDADRFEAQN